MNKNFNPKIGKDMIWTPNQPMIGKMGTNLKNSPVRDSTNLSPQIPIDKSVGLLSS